MDNIHIHLIEKPARKVLIKRGRDARDYFAYCGEVGCDIWEQLLNLCPDGSEPVCLWLPDAYVTAGTSVYVQGVEFPADFQGPVPQGFGLISLPRAEYLQFQGQPFREEDYADAIEEVWQVISSFDPVPMGYAWDEENPRIQLEPRCERGYIQLKAVKKV